MKLSPAVRTATAIIDRYPGREMTLSKPELLNLIPDIKPSLVKKARQIFISAGIGQSHNTRVKGVSPSIRFIFPEAVTDDLVNMLVQAETSGKESRYQSPPGKPDLPERVIGFSEMERGRIVKATGDTARLMLASSDTDRITINIRCSVKKITTYEAVLTCGQHSKRITGTVDTKSASVCGITAATEALSMIKKKLPVLIETSNDFYTTRGRNRILNENLLKLVRDKDLAVCICMKNQYAY